MMLKVLCPGIALLGQGQRANAFAGQCEESIANGGQHGRQSRFAQSRWGIIGLEEMNLDFRRSLLPGARWTSATSAKCPRWLKWKATPMAVSFGSLREPQPDFSATSSSTPRMRLASNNEGGGPPAGAPSSGVNARGALLSMASRNCTGSLPAA